jgi:Ca2+-binding RTX toxin-like protein
MAAMGAAMLLLVSGVAYALTIQCDDGGDQNPDPGECYGTEESDNMTGNSYPEVILSFSGNDRISALGGDDSVASARGRDRVFLHGGNDTIDGGEGKDVIHGGPDNDGSAEGATFADLNLEGTEDSDVVYGEEGDDLIDAVVFDTSRSRDRSYGGPGDDLINADDDDPDVTANTDLVYGEAGNDEVFAADNRKDKIDCGEGEADIVHYDQDIDRISNCETQVVETP